MEQIKMVVVRFNDEDILTTSCGSLGTGWTKNSYEAYTGAYGTTFVDVTGNTENISGNPYIKEYTQRSGDSVATVITPSM